MKCHSWAHHFFRNNTIDTRNRRTGATPVFSYVWATNGSPPPNLQIQNGTIYSGFEEITSTRGRKAKGTINPVVHYKHTCAIQLQTWIGYVPAVSTSVTYQHGYWCSFDSGSRLPVGLRQYGFSLGDFKREAGNLSDTNLLNSIRELKEFPKLLQLKPKDLRPDKALLAFQFGIEALFNDIKGFYLAAKSYDKRWKQLQAAASEHRRVNLLNNRGLRTNTVYSGHPNTYWQFRCKGRVTNRASCFVYTQIPDSPFSELLYRLDDLGIGKLASTFWEAIPYSFVVDYFLKISDMIANLDPVLSYDISAHHFCRSAKLMADWDIVCTRDDHFRDKLLENFVFASGTVEMYIREPFLDNSKSMSLAFPNGTGIVDKYGEYNGKRIATLAALISSRI